MLLGCYQARRHKRSNEEGGSLCKSSRADPTVKCNDCDIELKEQEFIEENGGH